MNEPSSLDKSLHGEQVRYFHAMASRSDGGRRHALRTVVSRTVDIPNPAAVPRHPRHDPFDALEESA
ncbi:hypothetical protein OG930_43390 [Streptomyces sp. NBC_01799]|uniref:hypothetical protein n=1 Tax=Streptomyces sp. NBC_01800 TaxID=2975945 RepID=UPI002DD8F722|nr:hypothetical protein [Streptomyces sp. NBC_01800]WSA74168.1 hypothetical protein OIE65_44035 [Streptomyces sp. NBC_01800]WSA82677.1 hypothetical protein OG930_43390 [Streptomyces sp. NBC_01799]